MAKNSPVHVVWFKRDLRVQDHRPLARARMAGEQVLPLYIIEPEYWKLHDTSERHYLFLLECLESLNNELKALGTHLNIMVGDTVSVFEKLNQKFEVACIYSHQETGNAWTYARDLAVGEWCKQSNVDWIEDRQDGVIRRLKSRAGWAKAWDRFMGEVVTEVPAGVRWAGGVSGDPVPTAIDLGLKLDYGTLRQKGGRIEAERTLRSFLCERGEPYRRTMSSPLRSKATCSRLSPYIANGVLSMREVAQATWSRQRDLKSRMPQKKDGWRGSMTAFSARLHWRCHFMQKLDDEPEIEFKNFHGAYDGLRDPANHSPKFDAWAKGETGYPFLDACIRSLIATGWINFRMRAMLVATASYHLWLHWKRPGDYLAGLFTDYEPGIHWPQVQMQSGTTGINAIRIYNPLKQGYDQDPDGDFIREWLPELADIPDAFIHEPWLSPDPGGLLGRIYPKRIFDHQEAARVARDKIWAVRNGADHRLKAKKIVAKHGSRKSGVKQTMSRVKKAKNVANKNQLNLFD
ncbi:FAD-binding domain-containing protein [Kordiimonas sp. SCSIO 12610]|uniref:FAD-binding domain-containing protein n=1 Tax=Kordiimonas sp. SCSIO 12610 TaxID=2829597 RepID=UPI00210B2347|nr:FAD-binding domain-containing protein [Kordiimonas sp. SCSIO 12610]UTW54701.1 deoxyribodipyrimidine photo-lyase [Kordiimonas sp. SCSIO 12610]